MAPGPHADSLNILENLALELQIILWSYYVHKYVVPSLGQVSCPTSPPPRLIHIIISVPSSERCKNWTRCRRILISP